MQGESVMEDELETDCKHGSSFSVFFFCFMTFHIELFYVLEGASLSEILFWILPALLSWRNCVQFNIKIWLNVFVLKN